MADETQPAQPFHPESQAFVEFAKKSGRKPYFELGSIGEAREKSRAISRLFQGDFDYVGTKDEMFVPSDEVEGGIPVHVLRPDNAGPNPPIYVYFHGGGMVVGCRESEEGMCKIISSGAGCIVVNVEYRLAPEHKFPAQMNDGCCVVKWVCANKALLGGSERSKVGIGGASAGGSISASVAHDCPGLDFCVLIYPHVSPRGVYDLPSYIEYEAGPVIERPLITWFEEQHSAKEDYANPRQASILRPSFDKLPPTLFIVAQCDPLRDDSYAYQKKLDAAGVPNDLYLAVGAIHIFYTLPGHFKELASQAYDQTITFIKKYGTCEAQ